MDKISLISQIKQEYDLPADIIIGKLLQERAGRYVYRLTSSCTQKKYIAKLADPTKTKDSIDKDTFSFSFLKKFGFKNCPYLITTNEGVNYITINDRFLYILEYIEGNLPENTIENWSKIGSLVGKLHTIKNYPYKTYFTFETEKPQLLKNAEEFSFKNEYLELVETLPNFDLLPQSLIHTDIGFHNSIKREDGELILIDCDDCGVGTRIFDLGFPLICQLMTPEGIFREDQARSFYSAYGEENKITEQEKNVLFSVGLFFALIYLPYGNKEENWIKIRKSLELKTSIEKLLDSIELI